MTGLVAQEYRRVGLDAVRPHPDNPRRGDVAAISESIGADGFYGAIVVQSSTGFVLAGNHRLLAAREQGLSELPAIFVDVDDVLAKRILLVDNRTAELATWDSKQLAGLLQELKLDDGGLRGSGFDDADLARLLDRWGGADDDDVPEPPKTVRTQPGDLWLLGGHRLVCGDATDPAVFAALLDGRRADMVWTDPPYGVAYTGKNAMLNAWDGGNRLETGIGSDELDREGLTRLLRDALGNATSACRPGASWWTAAPCLAQPLTAYANVLTELGVWHHTLVWVKDGFVLGRSDYHGRHEQLLYGWVPGAAHTPPRGRSQDSVWEIPRPRSNDTHPTMKPVELIARAIGNHTKSGHLVLDPFAGSGSTLIAADQLNRVAALIELDPAYCDVICRRYQTHTGGAKPVLEATGEPHDFAQEAVLAQVTGDG